MRDLVVVLVAAAAVVALGLFCAYTGFMVACTARRMERAGALRPGFRIVAYIWFLLGVVGDFVGNVWLGLVDFGEAPRWGRRELMFSSRVQRHVDYGAGARHYDAALSWARSLNAGTAPDVHIKRVPPLPDGED